MTRVEFAKKNKRYVCSMFYSSDDSHEQRPFYFIMDKKEFENNLPSDPNNIIKANTFKELMLNAVIKGIDLDDINFNKLSYVKEINRFLREHRIDHFETNNIDEDSEFISYS